MNRLPPELRDSIRHLRSQGKTYSEICSAIGKVIPKSTLSYICSGVQLPPTYRERIARLMRKTIDKARIIGTEVSRIKREEMFRRFAKLNTSTAKLVHNKDVGKIVLATLCLAEASKYKVKQSRPFSLGNADPRIICLFLELLKKSFISFDIEKVRCTVQCRAGQNPEELKTYWMEITGIPEHLFYKPLVDPRTVGKPPIQAGHKGVLRVYYLDSQVQLELESLADLVYNQLREGPVVHR